MVLLVLIYFIMLSSMADANDKCRKLLFEEIMKGKYLKGHVIRSFYAGNSDACQITCYIEEKCVSYNYGKQKCELNDSDHIFHPGDLVEAHGNIYRGTQNPCRDHKCHSNATCLTGFTNKGYKCACPKEFKGEYCKTAVPCSSKTTDGKCCVFPFIFQGTSYQSCTVVNNTSPWCATVPNADLHRQWGDCFGYVHVKIWSWGANDPGRPPPWGKAYIYINGIDHSRQLRGINIVAIDPNASIHSTAAFDTYGDRVAGIKMSDYINSLPNGTTVVVAIQDSAERHYQDALPALRSIGAKDPIVINYRSSGYIVGYKGERKPWVSQDFKHQYIGPTTANLIIPLG